MAQALRFTCQNCSQAVVAWSDGNPYYFDKAGRKKYAYHPDHERLERCVGNDTPHICLECGAELNVDSQAPIAECPRCGATKLVDTYRLDGQPCPYCKAGVFAVDQDFGCIS